MIAYEEHAKAVPFEPAEHSGAWLVIRTAPGFVCELGRQCNEVGARLWYPMELRHRRPNGKRKPAVDYAPAFPGYAFLPETTVKVDGFCDAAKMRALPHDRYQFLRMGGHFMRVANYQIQDLARVQWDEWCHIEPKHRPMDEFEVGDEVMIAGGMFGVMQVVEKRQTELVVSGWGKEIAVRPHHLERAGLAQQHGGGVESSLPAA